MTNGRMIAMTVCGLLLAAAPRVGHADDKSKQAKVKCGGINSCKGQSACATATNDCKGQNACKGKGYLEVATEKECRDKNGAVIADQHGDKTDTKPAPKKDGK